MNKVLLDLGFIEIRWYSFFILLAILVASFIIRKEAKKKNMDEEKLIDLIFYGLIFGIIGARTYYVLFNLDYYINNLLEIFQIWNGGLAIHGGIIAGLVFIWYYSKKHKINIKMFLDILVPGLIIAQAIGRWGNFFNQEAFGRVVELSTLKNMLLPNFIIEGMYINGSYREPTFFYESILCLVGFAILIIFRKSKKNKTGQLSAIYLIWYGIIRLIIEGMRSDSLMLGPIKIAQLVSLLFIVIGIIILIKSKNNKKYIDDNIILDSRRKLCTKK